MLHSQPHRHLTSGVNAIECLSISNMFQKKNCYWHLLTQKVNKLQNVSEYTSVSEDLHSHKENFNIRSQPLA